MKKILIIAMLMVFSGLVEAKSESFKEAEKLLELAGTKVAMEKND